MNRRFYRAMILSQSFFHHFGHIRYRGVPVARAMFYAFHRRALQLGLKNRKIKRIARKKRLLYAKLVKPERVQRIPYKKGGKIIFSTEAIEGLPFKRNKIIVVGNSKKLARKYRKRRIRFYAPSAMAPLNRRNYRKICRAIVRTARKKSTPRYFRSWRFIRWMVQQLKSVMRTIDGVRKLLGRNRVRGIVQHSSVHPLGYILTHMGKQRGIRTINLQYGINDDYQLMSTYVHYYVAWGAHHKKRLTQFGVPSKKVVMIGSARFDPIFKGRWNSKAQLARRLRISKRKWIFLYPEQPLRLKKNKIVLKAIIRALRPYRRRVVLIVKRHPRQKRQTLPTRVLRRTRFVKMVPSRKLHLYHLIRGSNAVFVQFSTVGIETLLMNRPLIALAFFRNTMKHEHTYFSSSRFITSARGQKKLNLIVKRFVKSGRFRRYMLRKQKVYRKGTYYRARAAKRIKRFIRAKCR